MSTLIDTCPRCQTKNTTLDVAAINYLDSIISGDYRQYEAFCICRQCEKATVFVLVDKKLKYGSDSTRNFDLDYDYAIPKQDVEIVRFLSIADIGTIPIPDHTPNGGIKISFREAIRSYAAGNWNAAGCMFRSCIDLTTKQIIQKKIPNEYDRLKKLDLKRRLKELFNTNYLDVNLEGLARCIREDGNDAVHEVTLLKEDAEDLQDFAERLIISVFTIPENIRRAEQRRDKRRSSNP